MNAKELKLKVREWADEREDYYVDFGRFDQFIEWLCEKNVLPPPIDTSKIFKSMVNIFRFRGEK